MSKWPERVCLAMALVCAGLLVWTISMMVGQEPELRMLNALLIGWAAGLTAIFVVYYFAARSLRW